MRFVPFLLVFFATSYLGRPVVAQKAGLRGEKEDDNKPLTVSGLSRGPKYTQMLEMGSLPGQCLTYCYSNSDH